MTNLGLDRMAESSRGLTIHQLNLVIERHVRPETHTAGVAAIATASVARGSTAQRSSQAAAPAPPARAARGRSISRLGADRQDSGLRENQRVTKGGRGQVRKVAYMATVSAVSAVSVIRASDNSFKARYLALVARGAPKKLATVAVMRAMIVTLNAMVRDNKPWIPSTVPDKNNDC